VFTDKYKPGDKIGGRVRSLTDYGVFVGIEEGVDGMVHKTDLSWTVRLNNPADMYAKGSTLQAIILSINHDEKKVSLGVKQLWDDPWPSLLQELPIGAVIDQAEVLSTCEYGVFVRLREGVEGLVSQQDVEEPEGGLKAHQKVKVEVSSVDTLERRLYLNMKNIGADKEGAAQRQKKALAAQAGAVPGTIGDLIKEKLGGRLDLKREDKASKAEKKAARAAARAEKAEAESETEPDLDDDAGDAGDASDTDESTKDEG
jgi:small subunit ribosomal protein S1